jgi:hypothetical protein
MVAKEKGEFVEEHPRFDGPRGVSGHRNLLTQDY